MPTTASPAEASRPATSSPPGPRPTTTTSTCSVIRLPSVVPAWCRTGYQRVYPRAAALHAPGPCIRPSPPSTPSGGHRNPMAGAGSARHDGSGGIPSGEASAEESVPGGGLLRSTRSRMTPTRPMTATTRAVMARTSALVELVAVEPAVAPDVVTGVTVRAGAGLSGLGSWDDATWIQRTTSPDE